VWSLVIPVKRLSAAKTRLAPLPVGRRAELALAFVHDCVTAALAAPLVSQVLVVTTDETAAAGLARLGARIAAEPAPGNGVDRLNAAISFGAGRSRLDRPELRVAALTGDLPSLRTEELSAVLNLATAIEGRSFVPDAAGSGTTLLLGSENGNLDPHFGLRSRDRHSDSGAAELFGVGRSVRQDVDTLDDLEAALRLGVGVHTAHEIGLGLMQGTVRSFDPETRGGTVLLDDGTELPYDAAAFDAGGLRLARVGQRVALRADAGGRITALTLATLPLPD
jgi:2-phospho-L-lactate/phosphoenolpyruvate guanylyltransferase